MIETVHGVITLPASVDISDPSYDEDVWCRVNNFPVSPGTYECYTLTADDEETGGWGKRIARIGIRKPEYKADRYERKAIIGVDSGLAGFYDCDNLIVFDEIVENSPSGRDVFLFEKAFVSSSGYGDGAYSVYVGYCNQLITDVYIEFIEAEE